MLRVFSSVNFACHVCSDSRAEKRPSPGPVAAVSDRPAVLCLEGLHRRGDPGRPPGPAGLSGALAGGVPAKATSDGSRHSTPQPRGRSSWGVWARVCGVSMGITRAAWSPRCSCSCEFATIASGSGDPRASSRGHQTTRLPALAERCESLVSSGATGRAAAFGAGCWRSPSAAGIWRACSPAAAAFAPVLGRRLAIARGSRYFGDGTKP